MFNNRTELVLNRIMQDKMLEKNKQSVKSRKIKNVSSSKISKPKTKAASKQELPSTGKEMRISESKKSKGSDEIDNLFKNLKTKNLDYSNQQV